MQQATALMTNMWQLGPPTDQNMPKDGAPSCSANLGVDLSRLAWLGRFRKALQAADKQSEQGQERVVSNYQDEVMRMILTALLDHPELEVQAAAAEACAEAVRAFPITGISLLPLLMYKLQHSMATAQQGKSLRLHKSFWLPNKCVLATEYARALLRLMLILTYPTPLALAPP